MRCRKFEFCSCNSNLEISYCPRKFGASLTYLVFPKIIYDLYASKAGIGEGGGFDWALHWRYYPGIWLLVWLRTTSGRDGRPLGSNSGSSECKVNDLLLSCGRLVKLILRSLSIFIFLYSYIKKNPFCKCSLYPWWAKFIRNVT